MRALVWAAVAMIVVVSGAPVAAQDGRQALLGEAYVLWGMMDAVAGYCGEASGDAPGYEAALESWRVRSAPVRQEIDALREGAALPDTLSETSEKEGADAILALLGQAANAEGACENWLRETNEGGYYEAETFLATQLGELREREGM